MYKPINGWTKAKIIKHIKTHFKGVSADSNGTCYYRGANDKKCAVGMFIPDSKYKIDMEGMNADSLIKEYKLSKVMPLSVNALTSLQHIHDAMLSRRNKEIALINLLDWIKTNVR